MKIVAHCLVKNEARFVWYAVMSVINHVDKVLLWDTGSSDGTLEIIEEIKKAGKRKVHFQETGGKSFEEDRVRQAMLEETFADWILVVDGDEIWWEDSLRTVVDTIQKQGNYLESIVVPTINLVGDMFHYQEAAAGFYELAGRRGHLNLRAVNRHMPGLHWRGPHGKGGWADGEGKMIQHRDPKKIRFLEAPYLHATHLARAGKRDQDLAVIKRAKKLKHELGIPFARDFYYPEVFFGPRPKVVPSVWEKMSAAFAAQAALETPFRRLKRRLLPHRSGY